MEHRTKVDRVERYGVVGVLMIVLVWGMQRMDTLIDNGERAIDRIVETQNEILAALRHHNGNG